MPKSDRLQTEQEHQKRAFEHYAAQRGRRSYKITADVFGVSPSTVKLWSRSFGWRERLQEQEAEQTRQLADRTLRQGTADSERNLKIVQAALIRLAKGIAQGAVRMQMGDLDRLIRLEEHLKEESGVGQHTDYSSLTDAELLARMRELHAGLGADIARLEGVQSDGQD